MFNRQVVKSDTSKIMIPDFDFEIPPEAQRGFLSTKLYPPTADAIDEFLIKLKACEDPSGNSFIENPYAPCSDPLLSIKFYERTREQNRLLRHIAFLSQQEPAKETKLVVGGGTSNVQEDLHGSVEEIAARRAIMQGNSAEIADALFHYSAPQEPFKTVLLRSFELMGVGTSQDKASEQHDQESSKNGEGKANQSSKRVSLPHNCEDILKHADSPVEISSSNIPQELYSGIFLDHKRKKYWVDKQSNCNCFLIFAQSLSITWADDKRFWNWSSLGESSDECVAVAELLDVCWLEVHGKFEISNLTPDRVYEVVFVVMLKDPAYGWEIPVNLRVILPDGSKQEHKENLMEKGRGRWIEISAGEIKRSGDESGEMEFSLFEYEGGEWKRGLLIEGVKIQPKA